jgi:hypothetical protein
VKRGIVCPARSMKEAAPACGAQRGGRGGGGRLGSAMPEGYGPPQRGYSPSKRVRRLPQEGHRGQGASSSFGSGKAGSAGCGGWAKSSNRSASLGGLLSR